VARRALVLQAVSWMARGGKPTEARGWLEQDGLWSAASPKERILYERHYALNWLSYYCGEEWMTSRPTRRSVVRRRTLTLSRKGSR